MFWSKPLINRQVRRRFAVTLTGNEGTFTGVLTEADACTLVFEDVRVENGDQVAGRVFADRLQVAYLQELGA